MKVERFIKGKKVDKEEISKKKINVETLKIKK